MALRSNQSPGSGRCWWGRRAARWAQAGRWSRGGCRLAAGTCQRSGQERAPGASAKWASRAFKKSIQTYKEERIKVNVWKPGPGRVAGGGPAGVFPAREASERWARFPRAPSSAPGTGPAGSVRGQERKPGSGRWLPENACPLSAFSSVAGLPDGVRSAPDLHSKSFLLT